MRRYTDGEHGFGDIMPEATVHIRPLRSGDTPLTIQNYDYLDGQDATSSRTVGVTGTTAATVTTAAYVSVPVSSAVYIDVAVTAYCTAGAAAGSGTAMHLMALATSGGSAVNQISTIGLCGEGGTWLANLSGGAGVVALVVQGSAGNSIKWAYDLTAVALYY